MKIIFVLFTLFTISLYASKVSVGKFYVNGEYQCFSQQTHKKFHLVLDDLRIILDKPTSTPNNEKLLYQGNYSRPDIFDTWGNNKKDPNNGSMIIQLLPGDIKKIVIIKKGVMDEYICKESGWLLR